MFSTWFLKVCRRFAAADFVGKVQILLQFALGPENIKVVEFQF